MSRNLYIGFKGKNNSSGILAGHLSEAPYLLTNSFQGVERDIELLEREYTNVLMFGSDKELSDSVRIESVAKKNGEILHSAMDLVNISEKLSLAGIKNEISDKATCYLCNEAYWFTLQKFHGNAVFLHIPSIRNADELFYKKMKLAMESIYSIKRKKDLST